VLPEHVPLHVPFDSESVAQVADDSGLTRPFPSSAASGDVPFVHPLKASRALGAGHPVGAQAIGEREALQALVANVLKGRRSTMRMS
jgi:hypothetical protein